MSWRHVCSVCHATVAVEKWGAPKPCPRHPAAPTHAAVTLSVDEPIFVPSGMPVPLLPGDTVELVMREELASLPLPAGARDFHMGPLGYIGYALDAFAPDPTAPASVDRWETKTAAEILEDMGKLMASLPRRDSQERAAQMALARRELRGLMLSPAQVEDVVAGQVWQEVDRFAAAADLFRYEAPPLFKLAEDVQREHGGMDWTYSVSARMGGVSIMRPMAVCLASIADVGDDKLTRAQQVAQPLKAPTLPTRFKGKRGQKRNRRQRREGRARHAAGILRRADHADVTREAETWPGPAGDDRPDACTIHVEDIPRVGERARERAQRVPFGGAW